MIMTHIHDDNCNYENCWFFRGTTDFIKSNNMYKVWHGIIPFKNTYKFECEKVDDKVVGLLE